LVGELRERQRLREMFQRPRHAQRDAVLGLVDRNGRLDVLRLTAVAVWRHDEPASDGVRHGGTEVFADEVQAQVEPGRASGAGEDSTAVDVERCGVDAYPRVPVV
jgi:hypothetical protein